MRVLITTLAMLAVPGAILQPFGAWALRWKIGTVQFAVLVAMTIVRSFSRRYLAQTPPNYELTDTQELASLVISISASGQFPLQSPRGMEEWLNKSKGAPTRGFRRRVTDWLHTWCSAPNKDSPDTVAQQRAEASQKISIRHKGTKEASAMGFQWGVVTGRVRPPPPRERRGIIAQPQMSNPLKSSIGQKVQYNKAKAVGPRVEVERFTSAAREMPHLLRAEVHTGVRQLADALERIVGLLRAADVDWKGDPIFGKRSELDEQNPDDSKDLEWKIPLAHGNESGESPHKVLEMKSLALYLTLLPEGMGESPERYDWVLDDPHQLSAVLSLWLSRLGASRSRLSQDDDLYKRQNLWRIVGVGSSSDSESTRATLRKWTGRRVYLLEKGPETLVDGRGEPTDPAICFGMHLTYPPEPPQ